MIEKGLIFYFVRKIIEGMPKDLQEKLKGISIIVYEDFLKMDSGKEKSEILGNWKGNVRAVEFFLPTIRNYIATEKDIYKALRMIESVVEHELLHAVGMSHEQIKKYREGKEVK